MKHAALIVTLIVVIYVIFQFLSPKETRAFRKLATKHGLRLVGLLVVVALLIAVAANLPASPLL